MRALLAATVLLSLFGACKGTEPAAGGNTQAMLTLDKKP